MNVPGRRLWAELKRGDMVLGHFPEPAIVADVQVRTHLGYLITFVGIFGRREWPFGPLSPVPNSVTVVLAQYTMDG